MVQEELAIAKARMLTRMVQGWVLILMTCIQCTGPHQNTAGSDGKKTRELTSQFELAPFPDTEDGKMAALGKKLITETAVYLGPGTSEAAIGNHMACSNCHLEGGTKPFAAPYIGLTGVFPAFIGRENKVETLEERINGCFERSMNGSAIASGSKTMQAIVSYIRHISKDVAGKGRINGQGFTELNVPKRAADIKAGEAIYAAKCIACHREDGQGMPKQVAGKTVGYVYPPLWGNDSYNDGAGMARLLTAARFIKGNMPFGATADNPQLSDEEAYDVAAYINSKPRPAKAHKELDYPNLAKKPKDCPYPPYLDSVPLTQHRYGPFNF